MRITIYLFFAMTTLLLLAGCATQRTCGTQASVVGDSSAHDSLRDELLDLKQRDQDARAALVAAMETAERGPGGSFQFDEEGTRAMKGVNEIDTESSAFLEQMIDQYGWPTYDMVGKDAAHAAWLLAQHADQHPDLQQRILDLMEPLVAQGQASGSQFAMLTDRVLTGRGEPQVYATQFTYDEDGVLRPSPTIDWANIEQRRASVGLDTMAEYKKRMEESYHEEVSTEPIPIE